MSRELEFIKDMFDSIAPKYDFLNRFLSAGQDIIWRREMVESANIPDKSKVLDVACGTCDVALEVKKQKGNKTTIFATDFSPVMLTLGKKKVMKSLNARGNTANKYDSLYNDEDMIKLIASNALSLPFKSSTFDAVFIAFGIRNIINRQNAMKEFCRTLRYGGTLAILELTSPPQGFFRDIYLFYFKRLLPAIGAIFSQNSSAYHYLPESVSNFPTPKDFAKTIKESGFEKIKWKGLTLGIVTLFIAKKEQS